MDSKTVVAWEGKSWRLCVTERTLANDSKAASAYIDHPGSVVIVPWRDSKAGVQVLMLRQYRVALDDTILELPAGTRSAGEDWLVCAQRELREETGFRAERLDWLGQCWPAPGVSNEVMTVFLARDLKDDPLPQDSDEEIELVPYYFDELVAMALDGRLQDAKSVVGILRAAHFLQHAPFNG